MTCLRPSQALSVRTCLRSVPSRRHRQQCEVSSWDAVPFSAGASARSFSHPAGPAAQSADVAAALSAMKLRRSSVMADGVRSSVMHAPLVFRCRWHRSIRRTRRRGRGCHPPSSDLEPADIVLFDQRRDHAALTWQALLFVMAAQRPCNALERCRLKEADEGTMGAPSNSCRSAVRAARVERIRLMPASIHPAVQLHIVLDEESYEGGDQRSRWRAASPPWRRRRSCAPARARNVRMCCGSI